MYQEINYFRNNNNIYSDKSLEEIKYIKGKNIIQSRYDILRYSEFGEPSLYHSFTSQAHFKHTLGFILKSGYVITCDRNRLLDTYCLFDHLNRILDWYTNIDFISLILSTTMYSICALAGQD